MENLFGEEITISEPKELGVKPYEQTIFLVATWYNPWTRWKLWRKEFDDYNAAKQWAEERLAAVRGHTHYVVLKIKFPGRRSASDRPGDGWR